MRELPESIRRMIRDADNGLCPFCRRKVDIQDFRDVESFFEFDRSRICQKCQDSFFKDLRSFDE